MEVQWGHGNVQPYQRKSTSRRAAWQPAARVNIFHSDENIFWMTNNTIVSWNPQERISNEATYTPPSRSESSLVFIWGKLYAFGGNRGGQPCEHVESFDLQRERWCPEPSMPLAEREPYIVRCNSKIYVFSREKRGSTQIFDPDEGTWETGKEMPGCCQFGAAVVLKNHIFVVGGKERACFRYLPVSNTWATLSRPAKVHTMFTTAVAWRSNILLCGKDHGEKYNPDSDTWSPCDEILNGAPQSMCGMLLCTYSQPTWS